LSNEVDLLRNLTTLLRRMPQHAAICRSMPDHSAAGMSAAEALPL